MIPKKIPPNMRNCLKVGVWLLRKLLSSMELSTHSRRVRWSERSSDPARPLPSTPLAPHKSPQARPSITKTPHLPSFNWVGLAEKPTLAAFQHRATIITSSRILNYRSQFSFYHPVRERLLSKYKWSTTRTFSSSSSSSYKRSSSRSTSIENAQAKQV